MEQKPKEQVKKKSLFAITNEAKGKAVVEEVAEPVSEQQPKATATGKVRSAQRGCKEGHERKTYVFAADHIAKISNLAGHFRMTESAVLEQIIEKGIASIVADHGEDCIKEGASL